MTCADREAGRSIQGEGEVVRQEALQPCSAAQLARVYQLLLNLAKPAPPVAGTGESAELGSDEESNGEHQPCSAKLTQERGLDHDHSL